MKKSLRVKYTIFESKSGILVDEGEKIAAEGQSLEITSGTYLHFFLLLKEISPTHGKYT